ncbi:sugar transporter [Fusarium longipes]|uniref:Sugar transporter n=1 Tax=Fusarium longipes TaxID=694270 RepID=A0A395SYH1_9HYPO|nr:sugar transporter [Fusarium longipes]
MTASSGTWRDFLSICNSHRPIDQLQTDTHVRLVSLVNMILDPAEWGVMAYNTSKREPSDDLDGDSESANSSEVEAFSRSFFTDDFPLNVSANTQGEFWLDPSLSLESWQTTPPTQTDTSRDISPLATTHERIGTPSLASPSSVSAFAGLPPFENQHQSLPRRRSQYLRSQLHGTASEPILIPRTGLQRDNTRNPMQRWQDSPPEAEPASLSAIADALEKTPLRTRSSVGSLGSRRGASRAGSIASFGSATSCSSASVGSPHSTAVRRGRVAKSKRVPTNKGKDATKRRFPCTFCCDSFKSKYDWARHERSLHLDLQGWRCTPFGGTVVSPDTGRSHCAYCSQLDPSAEHLETHNHSGCQNDENPHVFSRKDHLVQHLRLVHHVKTLPIIDSWKVEGPPIKSRCGICDTRMETWQERVEHLAKHFRKGDTMEDWKGEHDFEPHISAKVMNSLAPYMIAAEERAPVPFSATDPSSRDHLRQIVKNAVTGAEAAKQVDGGPTTSEETSPLPEQIVTQDISSNSFPEFMVHHLGRYAQQQMRLGIVPTDEMFQTEARRLVYETLDPWDQTLADNKDWLSCFRNCYMGGPSTGEDRSQVDMPLYATAGVATSCVAFLFGMDTGSIGPITTMSSFKNTFGNFSATIHGVIVSTILIPGALAALVAGALAHRFGHVRLIAIGSVIFGIGAAIECGAPYLGVFIFGRLIKGMGEGLFLSNVYVQVSEMSPSRVRGIMTALPQFLITTGIVTGYFTCYGTSRLGDSSVTWRLPLAIVAFLGILLSMVAFIVPPSPRWLLSKGRTDEARVVCRQLGIDEVEEKELLAQDHDAPGGLDGETTLWQDIHHTFKDFRCAFSAPYRGRTAFACFLMGMQQFSGIDGILYYAPILFTQAGLSGEKASFLASGVSAVVILAATLPAMIFADRWGRRMQSILGGVLIVGLMVIMGSLYAAGQVHPEHGPGRWVVIVCIYLFAIAFSLTWAIGFRTWVVESMPRRTRSSASSLAQSSNWTANYIVALVTPVLLDKSSFGAYYLFAGCSLATTVMVILFMGETKGYSLEEIEKRHGSREEKSFPFSL